MTAPADPPSARSNSLSSKILAGLATGIAVGLFVGERAAVLQIVSDGYIKLLQMTVLPYVTVSIISGLGALSAAASWHRYALLVETWKVAPQGQLCWLQLTAAQVTRPILLQRGVRQTCE